MNKNKKQFFKKPEASKKCSCGRTLSKKSRMNYPFGHGSKGIKTVFYKCNSCGFKSN